MGSDKVFKHESVQDSSSILKFLDAVRDGFASGTLVLAAGDKELDFTPQGLVKFAVEAKRKDDRCKFSLKFSWKEEEDSDKDQDQLEIRSE
ncbi:MAG: amphi-Trp domain-containing protein [Desulfovibrio sp.]|nr:MAG: amphi-Trp domain-containing protein [Desulfovibrio sp.]